MVPLDAVPERTPRARYDPRPWESLMAHGHLPAGQQVQVGERVTFTAGPRAVSGYVARKGRTFAHVVTDDGAECRVPYRLLSRVLGTPRQHVQSRTDL